MNLHSACFFNQSAKGIKNAAFWYFVYASAVYAIDKLVSNVAAALPV
jgi:hypothetical protein